MTGTPDAVEPGGADSVAVDPVGVDSGAVNSGGADSAGVGTAAEVLALLGARGQSLAVAESLTGGLVAAAVTAVPGASKVFRGSVTAYATELKQRVLGVDGTLLAERGAVDPEVAAAMARGVRRVLGADWGIATTGVAGPESQDGRPVGTVYVAVAGPGPAGAAEPGKVAELRLNGGRTEIRRESVRSVLELLASELIENVRAQDTEQNGGN